MARTRYSLKVDIEISAEVIERGTTRETLHEALRQLKQDLRASPFVVVDVFDYEVLSSTSDGKERRID